MASTDVHQRPTERPAGQYGLLVFDHGGTILHVNDFARSVLDLHTAASFEDFASRVRPERGSALPEPGTEASARVTAASRDSSMDVTTHVVRLRDAGGGDAEATVFVLIPADDLDGDPVIDRAIAAVLSHELRTPVTTIYAGSQILLNRQRLSEESQRETLADIRAEAERLYRLVEDLLVANRGRGIEVMHEPLLLQRLLPRLVAVEAERWADVTFTTTIASELPAVRGDERYLEHVVRDLLANAGSFTPPGGTVRIDARWNRSTVDVRVLDEGPGVDDADLRYLFRPFGRVAANSFGRPGPGLGLYVCKLLVEAMGGRIWGRRRPVGGSEFGFTLLAYADEA